MSEVKVTYKSAVEFVLKNCEGIPAPEREKLEALVKSLEKRATAPRAPSPEVKENAKLRQAILDTMVEGKDYSINDLIAVVPGLATASSHKVSALLTPLKNDGKIIRVEIKRKAYFRKATAPTSAE